LYCGYRVELEHQGILTDDELAMAFVFATQCFSGEIKLDDIPIKLSSAPPVTAVKARKEKLKAKSIAMRPEGMDDKISGQEVIDWEKPLEYFPELDKYREILQKLSKSISMQFQK
jgi:hypothetical protein